MATNFPTGLDSYTTKVDNVDAVVASHVNDLQSAVAALETKLGINSSSVNTTIDYFLKHVSGAYRTHNHDGSSDDGASIPDTSLGNITTPGKVSGAALTLLANIPSGAGTIPAANIPSIDGAKLTGLANVTAGAGRLPADNVPIVNSPIITNLGSISTNQTLAVDTLYLAVLTGSISLTLPSPTSGILYNIMFQFTMGSTYTVTVPGSVTWNNSNTPVLSTTKRNRMVFDTIDGGTTWSGYFSQF